MSGSALLDRLFDPANLSVMFQPILAPHRGGWRLHAVESLLRGPAGTNMARADVMFEYLRRKGEEQRFDRVCVRLALEAARELPGATMLTINVHASTLSRDRGFCAFLADTAANAGIAPGRLVIEIVEHAPLHDVQQLARVLDAVRGLGARIALDDIGLGQSNYRMILECRPEYYKIDRYIVAGAATDPYRQSVLSSLADLAAGCGALSVAEGVECTADLDVVIRAGVSLVQGYLLACPATAAQLRLAGLFDEHAGVSPGAAEPAEAFSSA